MHTHTPLVEHSTSPTISDTILSLSPLQWLLFIVFGTTALVSGTWTAYHANKGVLIEVPKVGGTYVEALVGTPRFINPLLATSFADRDLVSVVYAGLLTRDAEGTLVPELAEGYTVAEDGLSYTFEIRRDAVFHDGTPVTAADVVFTVQQAANPAIRSPLYANWEGVIAEATDEHTVVFTIPEPYAPFIENTTIGILPSHIWQGLSDDEFSFSKFNTEPIGAGPYQIHKIMVDPSGIPERYELTAFTDYTLGMPNIARLHFNIYGDKDEAVAAYQRGGIDALYGMVPTTLSDILAANNTLDASILRIPQLRVFSVFLNHNRQPIFMRKEVREALHITTPRQEVVGEVLQGYGTALTTPLPDSLLPHDTQVRDLAQSTSTVLALEEGRALLEKAGWERDEQGVYTLETNTETLRLAFSLSTSDVPELAQTAERIARSWRELGADVEVKVFSASDLTQSVIRPRRHDALLFGIELGHEIDLYAFWHSSQRNDPGLNIAQFADIETDAATEALRTETDADARTDHLVTFLSRIQKERAALFVYTPDLTYLVRNRVHNVRLHPIATPAERFDTIHTWYIETDHVWPFVREIVL